MATLKYFFVSIINGETRRCYGILDLPDRFSTGFSFFEGMDMRKVVSIGYFLFSNLYKLTATSSYTIRPLCSEKPSPSAWEKEELSYKGSGKF